MKRLIHIMLALTVMALAAGPVQAHVTYDEEFLCVYEAHTGQVACTWTSDVETDNVGFEIVRDIAGSSPATLKAVIMSTAAPGGGATYSYRDSTAVEYAEGSHVEYFLNDYDVQNLHWQHGPQEVRIAGMEFTHVAATGNVAEQTIELTWHAQHEVGIDHYELNRCEGPPCNPVVVMANFPASESGGIGLTTTYTWLDDTGDLSGGTRYEYQLVANTLAGSGVRSTSTQYRTPACGTVITGSPDKALPMVVCMFAVMFVFVAVMKRRMG